MRADAHATLEGSHILDTERVDVASVEHETVLRAHK